ncbi:MAG: chemotaxis protein CheW, partial [Clostridia bacterium]|nr:chemotaxis protein CheW [Clostridia bacterium]
VSEVVRIAADHIEPPADVFAGVETAYLRGVARSGDRLVVLLDLDRLLLRQEQAALTETVTAGDGGGRP